MNSYSLAKKRIRILLLEGVHQAAVDYFAQAGYSVQSEPKGLSEAELIRVIKDVHLLGIRSATQVPASVLAAAPKLIAIGCFCIGTNQVDLAAAAEHGVAVFNAPFSNTRSVAELCMAEVVMLARRAVAKNMLLHGGGWEKSAAGCFEVRHKRIGIIGYGHIGPQVGLLAEAFGMQVFYYDIAPKLPLGNAQAVGSLNELLSTVDFVTLHVPETKQTKNMIGAAELKRMRKGSYLLNLSRGTVVDIEALTAALSSGHLAGAAIDVFPQEPASNTTPFRSSLCGLDNVILTPHIGGSTLEAQRNIGVEVATALVRYSDNGSTTGSVNFPLVELPTLEGRHRVLNVHRNVPGVLSRINGIIADVGGNIHAQVLGTTAEIGYLITDVDTALSSAVKKRIEVLDTSIKTRILF